MGEIFDYVPDGYTMIYPAPQRMGKTLSMVVWELDAYQHGRTVFSNIQLGFPHEPLQFNEVRLADGKSRFRNGHIGIDELNFYFDSRRSMSGPNVEAGAFLLQQKKQGCNLTGTTHDVNYLDLRIREHYDYTCTPRVWPEFPKKPMVLKMVVENGPLQRRFRRTFTLDCRPFLGLYDSFAVYDPFKAAKEAENNDDDEDNQKYRRKPKSRYRVGF